MNTAYETVRGHYGTQHHLSQGSAGVRLEERPVRIRAVEDDEGAGRRGFAAEAERCREAAQRNRQRCNGGDELCSSFHYCAYLLGRSLPAAKPSAGEIIFHTVASPVGPRWWRCAPHGR